MSNLIPLTHTEFRNAIEPQVSINPFGEPTTFKNRSIDFDIKMTVEIYRPGTNGNVRPLKFQNCTFLGQIELGDYNAAGNVIFEDCTFNKFISVYQNSLFSGNTVIESARIQMGEKEEIKGLCVSGNLVIESYRDALNISDINVDCENRQGYLEVRGNIYGVVIQDVNLEICELRKGKLTQVALSRVDMDSVWVGTLTGDRPEMRIWSSKLGQFFSMEKQVDGSLLEIRPFIGSEVRCSVGMIKFNISTFERFTCLKCEIGVLEFYGENRERNAIDVSDVKLSGLVFRDLRNKGMMSFSSLTMEQKGCLTMRLASLGKTDFILCNFKAGNFEFENSKITEAFMAESDFATRIIVKGDELFAQEQLAFGQIATAFQKQGDTVRYLEYQSREIEAHYRGLKYFAKEGGGFSFTKLSLWLNKTSNDFGRNWIRGIGFSFAVGLVFFYCLVVSSSEYSIRWGFHYDDRLVASFFKFMNPLRFFETDNLFKVGNEKAFLNLTGVSYIIDFCSRVLVAFGYYQTIQAFRRYGRSR